ncbi:MAG: hypothetical protein II943_08730 [Victivallales bacterium]|nr:hypothetical protein [Victivallales bacterium]
MSSTVFHRNPALHPVFLALSVALHLAAIVGYIWYSKWKPAMPPLPIENIIEVTMFELDQSASALPQESIPVVEPTPEPVVEPTPEPVVEPTPEPVVEPTPPEETTVAAEEELPLPKPKTREELLRERIENAPMSKDPPKTPQKPRRQQQQQTDEAIRRIQERVSQTANSVKPKVATSSGGKVVGVSAAQMSRYQAYMSNCATPKLASLWNQYGPSGLDIVPKPATLTLVVEPSGRVSSYVISARSDSAAVNQGADAVGKALMQQGLPPFKQVGLATEGNASLTINFTLKYEH